MMANETNVLEAIRRERANVEWISKTIESLRERFGGRYIAVRDQSVIDSDKALERLLSRVKDRDGVTFEYVTELEYLWLL